MACPCMCRLPAATPSLRLRSIWLVAGDRNPEMTSNGYRLRLRPGQTVKEVQQPRVDRMYISRPKVAQHVINGAKGIRKVRPAAEVLDLETLASVQVSEAQRPDVHRSRINGARHGGAEAGRGERGEEAAAGDVAHRRSIIPATPPARQRAQVRASRCQPATSALACYEGRLST